MCCSLWFSGDADLLCMKQRVTGEKISCSTTLAGSCQWGELSAGPDLCLRMTILAILILSALSGSDVLTAEAVGVGMTRWEGMQGVEVTECPCSPACGQGHTGRLLPCREQARSGCSTQGLLLNGRGLLQVGTCTFWKVSSSQ